MNCVFLALLLLLLLVSNKGNEVEERSRKKIWRKIGKMKRESRKFRILRATRRKNFMAAEREAEKMKRVKMGGGKKCEKLIFQVIRS
jgi:hypothetical protein